MAPRTTRTLVATAIAVAIAACSHPGMQRTATFRARPDDVIAGDLRGPFSGRVVDNANQNPVAGALVYLTWSFEHGTAFAIADGMREVVASTDANGNYRIARLPAIPVGSRLVDARLVIYKRGFVAYRSDRRFSDFGPRRDFAQRDNPVALERWNPDYSHARHVRFVGGGGVIAAVTSWETDLAITELTQPAGTIPGSNRTGPYLVAAQLLTDVDIKTRTKFDGNFETGPLGDEPDTATYSSQHYKALDRPETWDVAVRMWRLDPKEAFDRYDELRSGLPGADERDEIATKSVRALQEDVNGVAFLDTPRGIVVLITCGKSQCPTSDSVVSMAQLIHQRIRALWPIAADNQGSNNQGSP